MEEKLHELLKSVIESATVAVRIVPRAKIVLMAFAGRNNSQLAEELGLGRHGVGKWRRRRLISFDGLVAIEMNETGEVLRRSVVDGLSIAYRSGRTSRFSEEHLQA